MTPNVHPGEEQLERYAMGSCSEVESAALETHLLVCEGCRARLDEADGYVRAMQVALRESPERDPATKWKWWNIPRLVPIFASLIVLVAASMLIVPFGAERQTPLAVALVLSRGVTNENPVPSGRRLALTPDLKALPEAASYRMEMVDATGWRCWQGVYTPTQGPVIVSPPKQGVYFVRVASEAGQLLREFELVVTR